MSEAPEQPPEAKLIRRARLAKGMSPEDAAPLTSGLIKASRWRQIENGYATRGGERIPTKATPEVLARMAFIVGVTPDRLVGVDCTEAAEILEEIIFQERGTGAATASTGQPDAYLSKILALWPRTAEWQRRAVAGMLEQLMQDSLASASELDIAHDKHRTA